LKQSPRLWQKKLKEVLEDLKFEPFTSDDCVYRNARTGIVIITYVDDFLLIGRKNKDLDALKTDLSGRFEMQDMGPVQYFLGVRIVRDRKLRKLSLVQDAYFDKILKRFNMTQCKPISSPLDAGAMPQYVPFEGKTTQGDISLYQEIIGSVQYAVLRTRPDLAFATSVLSRFLQNPSPFHMLSAKRLLRYLKATRTVGITYGGPEYADLDIHAYTDSDWAGCRATRRSTSGYVFFLAGGPVSWSSKRQAIVTHSSTEAEYYGLSNASREATWIRRLLRDFQYQEPDAKKTLIFADNQGAIALGNNPEFHQRAKHIEVVWHYIREQIGANLVDVQFCPTQEMVADGLTKPLPTAGHLKFVNQLGLKAINF